MPVSALEKARSQYRPKLPAVLDRHGARVAPLEGDTSKSVSHQEQIREQFPNTYGLPLIHFAGPSQAEYKPANVGVILSGGQAPGGHNVIAGLYDGIRTLSSKSKLVGFLGGPDGLIHDHSIELTSPIIEKYRNTGGFDIIGSGRTKLAAQDQFDAALETCRAHDLDAVVVIGGDDSNTNACMLAEYYASINAGIQVIGCPKTIDGDLKNEYIEASFGTDTACKLYAELIGNIMRDAMSARKYWHFIKLMGRSASHVTLECALQTQPNIALIAEEVAANETTLAAIVSQIADVVIQRANDGHHFGVALIPEGVIEFIPEMKALIGELNDLLAHREELQDALPAAADVTALTALGLTAHSAEVYASLPEDIQQQLVMDRDSHGNVQVSRIETEQLLIEMVSKVVEQRQPGTKFSTHAHFFGYEGRCAAPSNFDADYCYALGFTASALIGSGRTGYIAAVRELEGPARDRLPCGVPITALMTIERRHGKEVPVIEKALVELTGRPFQRFTELREGWATENAYIYPGPIQYFGDPSVADACTITLQLERELT